MIYVVVVVTSKDINLARFSVYFAAALPLIWPMVLETTFVSRRKPIKFFIFSIYVVYYFVYLIKMSNLTPYYFNPLIWQ